MFKCNNKDTRTTLLANLVPSASFRHKRKAKKRPWNTSNT